MKGYNFLDAEDRNKENLLINDDFIQDATEFLQKRENLSAEDLDSNEKIYDAYMEHFRYQNVNEVTAVRDLEYAQNANQKDKEQFARLIDMFESQQNEGFFDAAGDYVQGLATAPSTYLGVLTGGLGKLAAASGVQVAKLGMKKLLSKSLMASALRAGTVEGIIGTGQGLAQEMVKEETGYQDEINATNVALTGGVSALTGGIIGGGAGALQTKLALNASKKLEVAQQAAKTVAKNANKKAKQTLAKKGNDNKLKFIEGQLKALDPDKVALGKGLTDEIAEAKQLGTLRAGLPTEVFENVAAAALEITDKIKFAKGDRITSVLQKAISDGQIKTDDMLRIMQEYNITPDQFSLIYKAELSEAGRTLGIQGNLVQVLKDLENSGVSSVGGREAKEIMENASKKFTPFKDLDRARLGLMTSQPATTMRNNINAGWRVAVDTTVRVADNILFNIGVGRQKGQPLRNILFDGTLDMAKYMLNPNEARVTRLLLEKSMPDTARKLFRDAADLAASTGGESILAKVGTHANVLNTMSDNFFKQAMLTTSLKRRLRDAPNLQGLPNDLSKIIEQGKFNLIPQDIINKSIKDSLEFVYQSGFEGADKGFLAKGTRKFLQAHRDFPLTISTFIPFPRYIANQMQFLYEHAPVIGFMGLENIGKKKGWAAETFKMSGETFRKKLAQQSAGVGMMAAAYKWREMQGDSTYWYEFKDDQGNYVDGKAIYGPFAPFMLAADLLFRYNKTDIAGERNMSEIANTNDTYWREALQALTGSQFRTGYGMYAIDRLVQDMFSEGDFFSSAEGNFLGSKGSKIAGEFLGNIVNTFLIPVSAVKDIYSIYDKDARYVPETRTGDVDFFDIVANRGFRALPDLGRGSALGRALGQEEYKTPTTSPLRSGKTMAINPLEKQLFGFTKRPAKNSLQEEMGKLNLQYYDMYRRDNNEMIDLYTRANLSEGGNKETNLNELLQNFMESEEYAKKETQQEKRYALVKKAQDIIAKAKGKAKSELDAESEVVGELSAPKLQKYQKLSGQAKKTLNTRYKRLFMEGDIEFVDGDVDDLAKNIDTHLNRKIRTENGNVMTLYQWAMETSTDLEIN